MYESLHHVHTWCPWGLEESLRSSGPVIKNVSYRVGTRNRAWVLCKSSN